MRLIDDAHVEAATRALVGAIDAGDGGTAEQRGLLTAVVSGYWGRPDLDLTTLEPIEPDTVATQLPRTAAAAPAARAHGAARVLSPPPHRRAGRASRHVRRSARRGRSRPPPRAHARPLRHGPRARRLHALQRRRARGVGGAVNDRAVPPSPRRPRPRAGGALDRAPRSARGHPRLRVRRVLPAARSRAPRDRHLYP